MYEDLKEYAKLNKVPIVKDEGLEFLLLSIKKYNVSKILEVGCAIGYSALKMEELGCFITTLERNDLMYEIASSNIKKYNKENKIKIEHIDALEYVPNETYDMVFIDAAKSQNIKFFERFSKYLNPNGIIIVDNLSFHGLCDNVDSIESKNLRSMVKKINLFKEWLMENKDFDSIIYNLGDGMSLSIKK